MSNEQHEHSATCKLGASPNKAYNKFDFILIKVIQAFASNPAFEKALPEALVSMANDITWGALSAMTEFREHLTMDFSEPEPKGLKQIEIPYDVTGLSSDEICLNCGQRLGIHATMSLRCPALDEEGNVLDHSFVSNSFQPIPF